MTTPCSMLAYSRCCWQGSANLQLASTHPCSQDSCTQCTVLQLRVHEQSARRGPLLQIDTAVYPPPAWLAQLQAELQASSLR